MIWILLVVYQIKHFLADYPLQTPYMLGKFKKYPDFIHPLATHASVHALFTMLIAICCGHIGPVASALALFDFTVHFIVDRIKASPDLLGRFHAITKKDYEMHLRDVQHLEDMIKNESYRDQTGQSVEHYEGRLSKCKNEFALTMKSNVRFWWALGADQMAHHLTHYVIIYILVTQ